MSDNVMNVTFDQMLEVYDRGIIGTKEFREWLAQVHPTFGTIRDHDVDEDIIARSEANRQALEAFTNNAVPENV